MTTPRDAIGLSERLRAWSPMIASGYECPAASTAMIEAATALDALQARVKDYEEVLADKRRLAREIDIALHGEEGAAKQASLCDLVEPARRLRARVKELEALYAQQNELLGSQAQQITDCRAINDAAFAQVTRAEQERDTELQTLNDNGIGSHTEAVVLVVDLRRQLALAQQERDEAYERAAVAAESKYADVAYNAFLRAAGRGIAAAIRSLAAGTERGDR